jgi:hypothetical protein
MMGGLFMARGAAVECGRPELGSWWVVDRMGEHFNLVCNFNGSSAGTSF